MQNRAHYLKIFVVGTILKDICYRLGAEFWSVCSLRGLIYYRPANWSLKRQRPCANFFIIIIIYYELFTIIIISLISAALQIVVKIFKKYMEVDHFTVDQVIALKNNF